MNIIDTAQKKFDIEQFNVEWFDSKQFIQRNKKIRRYREERRNDRIYCALFGPVSYTHLTLPTILLV